MEKLFYIVEEELKLNKLATRIPIYYQLQEQQAKYTSDLSRSNSVKTPKDNKLSTFSRNDPGKEELKLDKSLSESFESKKAILEKRYGIKKYAEITIDQLNSLVVEYFGSKNDVFKDKVLNLDLKHSTQLALMEFLSDYKLPDLSSLSIVSCGDELSKVKEFIMNCMPYEINDFILNAKEVKADDLDFNEEEKEGSDSDDSNEERKAMLNEKRKIEYFKPSFEFVDELCNMITLTVTERIIIKGLELTTQQFCSLITAADGCSYIAIIGNKIENAGMIKLPYSELRNLKQLYLSDNNLNYEQIKMILAILEGLNCLDNLIYVDMHGNEARACAKYEKIMKEKQIKYSNIEFR